MVIGITGGVGCGKSRILDYLHEKYLYKVIKADEIAHIVKEKEGICYNPIVALLGQDVLDCNGEIDKNAMATKIFGDAKLLEEINKIIHPAVKNIILGEINKKDYEIIFIEAALLIEDCYLPYLDELWYIYASEEVRESRLIKGRGYSAEKVNSIFSKQMKDIEYRKYADFIIDNSNDIESAFKQIDERLKV